MPGRRILLGVVVAWSVGSVAAQAQAPPVPEARIVRAAAGGRLTPPSSASSLEILGTFLRSRGHSDQTARSVVVVSESRVARTGVTHLRLEQRAGTLPVYGVYVKASLSARGELVSVIENLVPIPAASAVQGQIGAAHALRAALRHLYGDSVVPPGLARREGDSDVFARTPFFHAEPRVTPVAVPRGDGLLGVAYLVETWSQKRNLLHHTLVGGAGDVRGVENRTANENTYKVFAVSPGVSAQTVESGEAGWLFPVNHTTTNIAGNNVHAYLDANADNLPDGGGTAVLGSDFLTTADLTASPGTDANRAVSVQNLFYLNNLIHDRLLAHGFNEAAGNFQETNSTGEGADSDSVNAEAQDGSGTDNANFATPADGSNPRMQMFLWNGFGTHQVVFGAATYLAQGASFGPQATVAGVTGPLVLVNDGSAGTHLACGRLPAKSLTGAIALIDRGVCTFIDKVKNVQRAGAIAAVIANNVDGLPFTMGGTGSAAIPSVMVGLDDGNALEAAIGSSAAATVRLSNPAPLMRDSALDADIVWHEYGHGLTWRMIGGMSGPMAGAIGEGMSDVLAILINEDDRVAEYSASDPLGIRSAPYTNYPRTYGDFSGTGVHFDGEIYGAIGWRLFENFGAPKIDNLLDYLVDGMNYTPPTPTFEQMRDGILQGISNQNDRCRVWDAFVAYGVGVGASALFSKGGRVVTVTESFDHPTECPAGLTTAQR